MSQQVQSLKVVGLDIQGSLAEKESHFEIKRIYAFFSLYQMMTWYREIEKRTMQEKVTIKTIYFKGIPVVVHVLAVGVLSMSPFLVVVSLSTSQLSSS